MAEQDLDLLLGRLAIHYKFLAKEQAQQAIRLWRATQAGQDLGDFLVSESYIPAEALPKLLRARTEYLRRKERKSQGPSHQQGAPPAVAAPATGLEAGPALPAPEDLSSGSPSAPVGATTVRLTSDMLSQAGVVPSDPASQLVDSQAVPPVSPEGATPMETQMLTSSELPAIAPALPTPAPPTPDLITPVSDEPQLDVVELPIPAASASGASAETRPRTAETPVLEVEELSLEPESEEVVAPSSGLLGYTRGDTLEDLLRRACDRKANDLHVHSGASLKLRLHGELHDASEAIDRETAKELIYGVLDEEQRELLDEHLQLDFSFEIPSVGRFRANSYYQHRGIDAVFRIIPPEPPTLEQLSLPENLGRFAEYHQGIVLFTGPAGCGKSSTMSALVRKINESRPEHILTIEDPIEYVHEPASCVVNQREIGPHTESFGRALRAALREDPDIIVIGELRDLETIQEALRAAETGHLVLGTLHTASTIPTLTRLVGVFPPDQQAQVRTMVSESLRGIVSQRLVPKADGSGRIPALEILINNKAIGNLIRENRTFQIKSILQTGGAQGMCELDASLSELVKEGVITKEVAKKEAIEPKRFA